MFFNRREPEWRPPSLDAAINSNLDTSGRRIAELDRDQLEVMLRSRASEFPRPHRAFPCPTAAGPVTEDTVTHAEAFALWAGSSVGDPIAEQGALLGIRLRQLLLPTHWDIQSLVELQYESDAEHVAWETFFLRVFAVDVGSFLGFEGNTPMQQCVLNSLYRPFDLKAVAPELPVAVPTTVRDRAEEYNQYLARDSGRASPLGVVALRFDAHARLVQSNSIGFRILRDTSREAKWVVRSSIETKTVPT
jgi:hypothetical protein